MRVLIQANTDPKDVDGYNLNLAFQENEILPWSDTGVLKNRKKDDIVFIIIKDDNSNKVMYKCIIAEDNVDLSTTIDDSSYYYSKIKQKENASRRIGTCLLLRKLQYIDDDRLYMKKLKEEGLTKRDFEQNHTTDKVDKRNEDDSNRKVEFFNRLDQVFNEYLYTENDSENIISKSDSIEKKNKKDYDKTGVNQDGKKALTRYLDRFTEEEILKVIKSYLLDGLGHRKIQSRILGLPVPDNGGGYIAMDILHYYNIYGDKKGILVNKNINSLIENATGNYREALTKIKAYIEEGNEATKVIKGLKKDNIVNTEIEVATKQRVGQDKLREYILDIYEHKCALCDIDKDDLLICSHIIPWRIDEQNRLNPQNAICLCAQHDKLFDKGYFSLDENYNVKLGVKADEKIINQLKSVKFREPIENSPNKELLKVHFHAYCL